ncbi:hypothetical protein QO002_002156 [Pararhizobium capsulatum DSM 1112]|uniref:Uncharacterized protein n=1 Tax=Pararhizobium capsulatum DSM 1112 TaxID=1121113 RepID=A0ABU0BQ10_9HYPH|nr:hypothetical protein [Pararhizobium capsulatum]MDQ0320018.1 hypothetical protein [Pararhizobium capsulatum DSM 1112]
MTDLRNTTLNEDERAALYGVLCREERDQRAVIAGAEAKLKDNYKRGKEWGFAKEEITFHEKARKAGDGSSIVQKHGIHKKILIKLGLVPDDRGGDLLTDRADWLQMYDAKGEADGLVGEGGPGHSKHPANSDEDKAYLAGWKRGQMKYAENWKAAMEKAQAARSKEEPAADPGSDPFQDAAE